MENQTAKERLVEGAKKNRRKLLQQPRKKREKKIAWVSAYDPRVPSKTAIIYKNFHLLYTNAVNKDIFPSRTIISADRKRPNLAQIYKPTVPQRHVQHGPPKINQGSSNAETSVTRAAIRKKPLFLFRHGTESTGPSNKL